jgi:hypothetical protein
MLCAKCHDENLADAVFCADCGVKLAPTRGAATPSKKSVEIKMSPDLEAIPDGERKTVTALFADIKGSTELIALSRIQWLTP